MAIDQRQFSKGPRRKRELDIERQGSVRGWNGDLARSVIVGERSESRGYVAVSAEEAQRAIEEEAVN